MGWLPVSAIMPILGASTVLAVVAGDPNGQPADSPVARVDPNSVDSAFAGVGSIKVPGLMGTGTLISPHHVLTAAHLFDIDFDGTADVAPADVWFNLNVGGDLTHQIAASAVTIHADFTGFANPALNDDLAIITLATPVVSVPVYPLLRTPLPEQAELQLVGYGQTGNGINGYVANSQSYTVKRVGWNVADAFYPDDEGSGINEIFEFDFDGNGQNAYGGGSLGNHLEATIGPGDSGSPGFLSINGALYLAGVNTFADGAYPYFGSFGGGMSVPSYAPWIDAVTGLPEPSFAMWGLLACAFARRRR